MDPRIETADCGTHYGGDWNEREWDEFEDYWPSEADEWEGSVYSDTIDDPPF